MTSVGGTRRLRRLPYGNAARSGQNAGRDEARIHEDGSIPGRTPVMKQFRSWMVSCGGVRAKSAQGLSCFLVLTLGVAVPPSHANTLTTTEVEGRGRTELSAPRTTTDYYDISLRRPGDVRGPAFGKAVVTFPDSPFNVAVTPTGVYVYDVAITVDRLPPLPGVIYVVWVASPNLDRISKAGAIARGETLRASVDFDKKFIIFVTEESSAEVTAPGGRVALQGVSRSGRLESMFSHGFCPPDTQC